MTGRHAYIRRNSIPAYFVLTFAISWAGVWLVLARSGSIPGLGPSSDSLFVYLLIAMLAGPSVSGLLMTALVEGRRGLCDLAVRLCRWRIARPWPAVALLAAPLLWIITLVGLSLISDRFLPGIVTSAHKADRLLVGLAVGVFAGIFEELGWTGFVIPHLRRRHTAFATGVIVGVLWGAWHLLTNVVWPSRMSAGALPLTVFLPLSALSTVLGYLVAFRVLMVWIYDRSESLLMAMVMHASLTATVLILDPEGLTGVALLSYSCALAAVVWSAVGVLAVRRPAALLERPMPGMRRAA